MSSTVLKENKRKAQSFIYFGYQDWARDSPHLVL